MSDQSNVLLGITLIVFTYLFTMYKFTMASRIRAFSGEFMKKFVDVHNKETKQDKPPQMGYPDCGSGWYSKQLPYKDWFMINCGQRCQLNFLEQMPIVLLCSVIGGLSYSDWVLYLDITYCVARVMYGFGYMSSPKMRVPGALLQDLALLGLIGVAYSSAYNLIK